MRRIIYSVLLVMVVLVNAQAYDFKAGDLYYNILNTTTVEVAACEEGVTGALVIPETVSYGDNTYTVTQIGANAFEWFSGLTGTLTIPSTVKVIGELAFSGCTGFTGTLVLPSGLTTINNLAFYGCTGFTGLELPETVTTIGQGAFYNCSGMTGDLTIPSGMTTIASHTFRGCTGFNGSLILPEGLKTIGEYAFYNCSNLSGSLTLPATTKEILKYAFYGCAGFTGSLTIPNPTKTIELSSFEGCSGLDGELTLGYQLKELKQNAFKDCSFSSIVVNYYIPPTIQAHSFLGIPDNTPLTVFCGQAQAYHDSENWSRFTNVNDDHNYPIIIDAVATNNPASDTTIHGSIEIIQLPDCDNLCVFKAQVVEIDSGYYLEKWQRGSANCGSDLLLIDTVRTMIPNASDLTAAPNLTYKAVFKRKTESVINLSVFPAGSGKAEFVQGFDNLTLGKTIKVKATKNSGYEFDGWIEFDSIVVSTDTIYAFESAGDRNLTARFHQKSSNVTAVCDPLGSARFQLNGSPVQEDTIGGTFNYGDAVTLKAIPRWNWVFVCWKDQDGAFYSDQPTLTFTANLDLHLTALLYSTVDVDEFNATVDIFPNPSKGVFTITGLSMENIAIYNTLGQLIHSEAINDNAPQTIDLTEQPNGIYIVQITTAYGISTKKVVKE